MTVMDALRAKVTPVGIGILLTVLGMSSCGGGSSSSSHLPGNNAVPSLISFSPFNATAGGAGFSLTLTGSGFASNATVMWNGNALATTFVSSNQLTAQVTDEDIAAAGIAHITVSNPTPGGGVSSVFRFGVNSTSPPPATFLYAANVSSLGSAPNTISGYSIDPNSGVLTALSGSPFTPSSYPYTIPTPIGMDRLNEFLYVADAPIPNLNPTCQSCTTFDGFTVNSTGNLIPMAGSPLFTQVPSDFVGDPTGNILYDSGGPGASQASDIVTMRIEADSGSLTPIAVSPGFDQLMAMALNPAGTFLYGAGSVVSAIGSGVYSGIYIGSVDLTNGSVKPVNTPSTPSPQDGYGTVSLAVHPSGKFLFAVNGSSILSYAIEPTTGTLTLLNSIPYNYFPASLDYVIVHPSGKFLYASDFGESLIWVFSIDGNGNLAPVLGSPFGSGGFNPNFLATDPAGKFLYVSNSGGYYGYVAGFTVDANSGTLTPMAGSPFLAGDFPGVIVITP